MTEALTAAVALLAAVVIILIRHVWRLNTRMSRIEGKLGIRNGNDR